MHLRNIKFLTNDWFFSKTHPFFYLFGCFVKGDLLILIPLVMGIALLGFVSLRFMGVMIGVYIAVRYLGEMIYWFSQQFNSNQHRPYDYGLTHLSNLAIYIIYQTTSTVWVVVGIGIVIYLLYFV